MNLDFFHDPSLHCFLFVNNLPLFCISINGIEIELALLADRFGGRWGRYFDAEAVYFDTQLKKEGK